MLKRLFCIPHVVQMNFILLVGLNYMYVKWISFEIHFDLLPAD